VITKSGTNNFHGDAHAYFRGRNLSASNYFYNLGLVEAGIPVDGAPRAPFQECRCFFRMLIPPAKLSGRSRCAITTALAAGS